MGSIGLFIIMFIIFPVVELIFEVTRDATLRVVGAPAHVERPTCRGRDCKYKATGVAPMPPRYDPKGRCWHHGTNQGRYEAHVEVERRYAEALADARSKARRQTVRREANSTAVTLDTLPPSAFALANVAPSQHTGAETK